MAKHIRTYCMDPKRVERFFAKVDKNGPLPDYAPHLGPCWLWRAYITPSGYGYFGIAPGAVGVAHRWSYEYHVGHIPEGLQLDHLCRVKTCVNPAHLEPVTHGENLRRGIFSRSLQTHCPHGHEYTPENTIVKNKRGHRECRVCAQERDRERTKNPGPVAYTRTHCKRGHELTPENTYFIRNVRLCQACRRLRRKTKNPRKPPFQR